MPGPDVIAYFADDPSRVYQLAQWLPVLEDLDAVHPVVVVVRQASSAAVLEGTTRLPVRLAESLGALTGLYAELDAHVVLYCNNSRLNFDSLIHARALHVHVNHGESDKQSMASNNAKAYDRVFVAGDAAVARYTSSLLELDPSALVRIGRPQLDRHPEPVVPPSPRRTVLYAPTWEGDADYNNYTSVDVLGPDIVRTVLSSPALRLVYKPHPQVGASRTSPVVEAHLDILARIREAALADPSAGHSTVGDGDILAVIPACDLMITDVSSVGLDWLYLRPDAPLVLADRYADPSRLLATSPLASCSDVLDSTSLPGLGDLLARRLADDPHGGPHGDPLAQRRAAMRRHYFGDLRPGESTVRFTAAIAGLVGLRDRLLADLGSRESSARTSA